MSIFISIHFWGLNFEDLICLTGHLKNRKRYKETFCLDFVNLSTFLSTTRELNEEHSLKSNQSRLFDNKSECNELRMSMLWNSGYFDLPAVRKSI